MKRAFILAVALTMALGIAAAADTSGSLVVNGNVASFLSLQITGSPVLLSLTGDGTGVEKNSGASVLAIANVKNWHLGFDSANDGILTSATASVNIPYLVKVDTTGVGGTITNPLADYIQLTGTPSIVIVGGKTPRSGVTFVLNLKINDQNGADTLYEAANDYTDTVTITIVAD